MCHCSRWFSRTFHAWKTQIQVSQRQDFIKASYSSVRNECINQYRSFGVENVITKTTATLSCQIQNVDELSIAAAQLHTETRPLRHRNYLATHVNVTTLSIQLLSTMHRNTCTMLSTYMHKHANTCKPNIVTVNAKMNNNQYTNSVQRKADRARRNFYIYTEMNH